MSRCHICDRYLENPTYNRDHKDINPCGVCMEIIHDVFGQEASPEIEEFEPTAEELLAELEEESFEEEVSDVDGRLLD